MSDLTRDTLLNIGFVDVAMWYLSGDDIGYRLDGERAEINRLLIDEPNALYAFARDDVVQYIGKTTRSVKKRFVDYRRPGRRQRTNIRCNNKIKEMLRQQQVVRILVFTPISDLRYLEFEINLAAGLEDALIKAFDPPWNGREKGKPISEDQEREETEEQPDVKIAAPHEPSVVAPQKQDTSLANFKIKLGSAYYNQGLINPGVDASLHLGNDGEPIQVLFGDGTEPVLSRINRTANPSGSVRVVGRNRRIAEWFAGHFLIGDTVDAEVLDAHRILLRSP